MRLNDQLWIAATIALAVLALTLGRWWSTGRRRRAAGTPLVVAIAAERGWSGDIDRFQLLLQAWRAQARLRPEPGIMLSLRAHERADLVLRRTSGCGIRMKLAGASRHEIARQELLPAIEELPAACRGAATRLAALLLLHGHARGLKTPEPRILRSLRLGLGQGQSDPYLAARLDGIEASIRNDGGLLRSALGRLLDLHALPDIDGSLLAINCGSLALDLAQRGDRTLLTRSLALLEREVPTPAVEVMRGRLLAMEAERAEDASMRHAALGILAGARADAGAGSPLALDAGLAEIDCLLMAAAHSGSPRSACSDALALIASLESGRPIERSEDRARLALARGRALYLSGIALGDQGLIDQALAALAAPAGPPSSQLRSEFAHWRGKARAELALRRSDRQQARMAIADFEQARPAMVAGCRARLDLSLAHVHGSLFETTRGEGHYLAAARAYERALGQAGPGLLSAAERFQGSLGSARLHLAADDMTPRPETVREGIAAWEAARASLPPGADALASVEMHRIGALALRKLSRLASGPRRVAALERAVGSASAALDRLTEASASSALRVGLLRQRGEMLAELASLGAGPAALEKSIASYRRALEEAEGIARADALEGLAQVLTDLAAARGETPPAAAHDALEEAYGLLVANGAPMRADLVLSSSRRLGPRPANDPL